ncbi:MAG: DUF4838 domain-containing protein [Lentisphaeria bacterium]|jgi:hypothetical protein
MSIIFVSIMLFFVCSLGAENAFFEPLANSRSDWDAAVSETGNPPAQGFRNWFFGFYDADGKPETFQEFAHCSKSYWGDGNFSQGAIFRDSIAWSTGKNRDVVRRWRCPADGQYQIIVEGRNKNQRRLCIYVDSREVMRHNFSQGGERVEYKTAVKAGSTVDFAWEKWGSSSLIGNFIINKAMMIPGLAIAKDGQSDYVIVIPENDAWDFSRRAAVLLQRIIEEMNGAKLPLLTDGEKIDKPAFFIGRTRQAAENNLALETLSTTEYMYSVKDGNIYLAGVNSIQYEGQNAEEVLRRPYRNGDHKAVVAFLENELGVRFLLPGRMGEHIPAANPLVIKSNLSLRRKPDIPWHTASDLVYLHNRDYDDYMVANNMFRQLHYRLHWGHSWPHSVPAEKYGKSNPEFFILKGGKRHPDAIGNQLCISNAQVQEIMLQHIDQAFARGNKLYQLGQSDGFQACECQACRELGETANERVWKVHRAMAEKMAVKYPDCKISIIAYDVTQEPPVYFDSFPGNVVIELTKYDEVEFQKWLKFKVPFMVYTYWWGCYNELGYLPKRTPFMISEHMKRLKKYQVLDVYNCGYRDGLGGLQGPVLYLYGRLFDQVDLNPELLVEDYCRCSFGDAGPIMYSMFTDMHKYLEKYPENTYFTCDDRKLMRSAELMISQCYPPSLINHMDESLQKASKLVKTPKEKMRLKFVELDFAYLKSTVKALTAYRAFLLFPEQCLLQQICQSLREREEAIANFQTAEIPEEWKLRHWDKPHYRSHFLAGGSLKGKLGAPFTWDYREMEKTGRLPIVKTKEAKVRKAAGAVSIDGKLDEKTWQDAPRHRLEKVSGGTADTDTFFQVAYDDEFLYFAFEAIHPSLAEQAFTSVGKDNYIREENIDLLINTTGLPKRYYQFIFGPAPDSGMDAAMNIALRGADPREDVLDRSWDSNWTYAFQLLPGQNKWTAEVRIPLKDLGGFQVKPGKSITMNVGRVHKNKLFLWSPNPEMAKFGNTMYFGNLIFE